MNLARILAPRPQGAPFESPNFTGWLDLIARYINQTGLRLLQTQNITTAVATVDFIQNIGAEFDVYLLTVTGAVPATDNVTAMLRISKDGTTFRAIAGDYRHSRFASSEGGAVGVAGSGGDTGIDLANGVGNSTGETANFLILFFNPSSTTLIKPFWWAMAHFTATPSQNAGVGGGLYDTDTDAITGIRFMFSAGNVSLGKFSLYGIRI